MTEPALPAAVESPALPPISSAAGPDDALDLARTGVGGQPAWQRDVLSVSSRVRAILTSLRPVVVRALTFWDHAVRTIRIGGARLDVDPSGSYRMR